MCGIFGGIGPEFELDKVKLLAVLNQSRGVDGGGLWNKKWYWKDRGPIKNQLNAPDLQKKEGLYLLGHTRGASVGAATKRNAHPFLYGRILGAHNGSVANWVELAQEEKIWSDTWVDSEVIFHLLNKYGIEGLRKLESYWGLVWTDTKTPDVVYLMSHDHMVHAAITKGAVYFSSDDADLKRAGLTNTFKLKDDYLYKIDATTCKITKEKIKGLKTRQFTYDDRKRTSGTLTNTTCATTWGGYDTWEEWDAAKNKKEKDETKEITRVVKTAENTSEEKAGGDVEPMTTEAWDRLIELEEQFDSLKLPITDLDEYEKLAYRAYRFSGVRYGRTGRALVGNKTN